jgi:hypothetical protein
MGMWVTLVVKVILGLSIVVILDTFCGIELGVVSWFLVATPFLVTALGTAIAIGNRFDDIVLQRVKENFYDKEAREHDLPEDTNNPAVKMDSKKKSD